MHILVELTLDNDLDLMIAHKRSMQIAEFSGLGILGQTSFATAVSELGRLMLEKGVKPQIHLGFHKTASDRNGVCAKIIDDYVRQVDPKNANLTYAEKLVDTTYLEGDAFFLIYELPSTFRLSKDLIRKGEKMFNDLPPVTPYEQAKHLNGQLQQMANRVLESEKKYQVLTDTLPLMMFTLNAEARVIFANKGFEKFSQSVINPADPDWTRWLVDSEANITEQKLRSKFQSKKAFSFEVEIRESRSAQKVWYLLSLTPITDEGDDQISWSGFLVNIQAQKLVEQTLRDNEELLATKAALEKRQRELDSTIADLNRSNQELVQFAYVASHDLQEPARKMVIFSDMLLQRFGALLPKEAINILLRIKRSSERMVEVIRDLLDYSRLSAERVLVTDVVPLSEIVDQVRENLESQILSAKASILIQKTGNLLGNPQLLILLFQNLIGNAVKFSRDQVPPVVTITASSLPDEQKSLYGLKQDIKWTKILIKDNGIGFDEQFARKIFQMFQRLHTQEHFKGTGIGLSICKRIVEMHNGHISVKSTVGEGSEFTVFIPSKDR